MTKQHIMYSACIVGTLGAAAIGLWHTRTTLYADRRSLLTCDAYSSPALHASLMRIIDAELQATYNPDATRLLQKISSEAPGSVGITLNYFIPGTVKVGLRSAAPRCIIKKIDESPMLLCAGGIYAPQHHYNEVLLQGIPSIVVTEKDFGAASRSALQGWFEALPSDFFARYHAQWSSASEITLRDAAYPRCEYCVTSTTAWTPLLEEQCMRVRATLPSTHKKYKKWIIDTRFKNQLILKGVS